MGKTWDITFDHRVEQTESPVSTYSPPPANFMPNFPAAQAAILDVSSYGLSYGDPVRRATIAQHDLSIMAGRYPYDAELSQRYDWLTDIYSQSNAHVAFIQARPLRYAKAPDFAVPDETQLQRELITATGSADLRYGLWWREGVQQTLLGSDVGSHGSAYIVNPDRAAFTGDQEDINDPVAKSVQILVLDELRTSDSLIKQATQGNAILAPDLNPVNLQNLIDSPSVVDGDTILLPDGDATWNSGISTSKAILIVGQNYPVTYRGNSNDSLFGTKLRQANGSGPMITMTSGNVDHCGVGGINFLRDLVNTPQYPYVRFVGAGSKVPVLFDCNLDCNKLNNGDSDTHGFVMMQSRGGVMWNIHWEARAVGTGTGAEPRPAGNDGSVLPVRRDGASWEAYTLGNQDTDGTANVYLEACSAFGMGQFPDTDVNGKFVARYNRFSGSNGTVHGHTSGLPPRHSEYYENDFDLENATDLGQDAYDVNGRWTYHRGGITVCHNNRLDTDEAPWSGRQVGLVSLVLECPGSDPNALGLDWNTWPVPLQAGMGWNGSAWERVGCWTWGNVATGGGNDPNYIGVGLDDVEIPPQPMSFYFQEGRDYFTGVQMTADAMTAAGMPNPFDYAPYTYPHPVRAAIAARLS